MSESEIIKVYQEGIQSVISLVQGLSTQISELSQTVSDLDARLKKLEKQSNQIKPVKIVAYLRQPMVLKRQKVCVNLQIKKRVVKSGIKVQP